MECKSVEGQAPVCVGYAATVATVTQPGVLDAELLSQPKVESESTSLQLLLSHWPQLRLPSLQPVQKESLTFHPLVGVQHSNVYREVSQVWTGKNW